MRKILSISMSLFMFIVILMPAMAQAKNNTVDGHEKVLINVNNKKVNINISKENKQKLSKKELTTLAEQASEVSENNEIDIFVHNVGLKQKEKINKEKEFNKKNQQDSITPMGIGYTDGVTAFRYTNLDRAAAAKFIVSVAQGSTKQFTSSTQVSYKFSSSVSGNAPSGVTGTVAAELTGTYTYTSQLTYNGPTIGSAYISFNYYVTPFYDDGTWTGYRDWWLGGTDWYSGNFSEYSHYTEWSMGIK